MLSRVKEEQHSSNQNTTSDVLFPEINAGMREVKKEVDMAEPSNVNNRDAIL